MKPKYEFLGKCVKWDLSIQTNGYEGANSHSLYYLGTHLNGSWMYAKVCKELKWLRLRCNCVFNEHTKENCWEYLQ
jgi:hypothetical protein